MFSNFKKNIYSQNGEDGILEEILKKLNLKINGWCCEFELGMANTVVTLLISLKTLDIRRFT